MERSQSGMVSQMDNKRGTLRKRLAALLAFVWLFSSVNQFMRAQIILRDKRFITNFTLERLLSGVNTSVSCQRLRSSEGFVTKLTLEDIFTHVGQHMLVEVRIGAVVFPTNIAL